VLGIGRGDSALTQLGRKPVHVDTLERALSVIQGYLGGTEVELDGAATCMVWIAAAVSRRFLSPRRRPVRT
jgi:hypothetical protein